MQPNIPLGARHHHTTLRVEGNQSRRIPTSWSLSKLPVSGLYLKLFTRGSTFLLAPPRATGPIARKHREKVELLSLIFLPFFSFSSLLLHPTGWSKMVKFGEYFLPHVNTHWLLGLPLSPYPSTLDFSPIMCCHMSLLGLT